MPSASTPASLTNNVTLAGGGSPGAIASDLTSITALAPANDEAATATSVGVLPYTASQSTSGATTNVNDPLQSCGYQDSKTVWYKYVADFTGALVVDTLTSSYDTVLSAYLGSVGSSSEVACNDQIDSGNQSRIVLQVTAGQLYYFEVGAWESGSGGTLNLHVFRSSLLSVTKTHSGTFAQGQNGVTYTITVSNLATALATSGVVTVTESAPTALTLVSMAGTGWSCSTSSCTRSDSLLPGSSYPPITVTANVSATATPFSNSVTISGGGSPPAFANDFTNILLPNLSVTKTHNGSFTRGQNGATYTVTVSNQAGVPATAGAVTVTDTLPAGLTLVSMTGPGWTCVGNVCLRSDSLAAGASYPPITVTVNISALATSISNQVTVSGGGMLNSTSASDYTVIAQPALSISKTHTGVFAAGQNGATYTIVVSSPAGSPATSGTVTVTDTVPAGLTLVSMAGTGWTCSGNSCARGDSLAGGSSYPAITATVNVAGNALSSLVNVATVSGGGFSSASISDYTSIQQPVLRLTKTHTGNFSQAQTGATYTLTVSNVGAASSGPVLVTDTLPSGLTLISMAGTGWTCDANTCTRSDVLAAAASFPSITVTVKVAPDAASPQVNTASVSGGNSGSYSTTDATTITQPGLSIVKTHTGSFAQGQSGTYSVTVSNRSGMPPTNGAVVVTEALPVGLTLVSMTGTGWTCGSGACNRSDVLAGGTVYQPITVTVNVAADAPAQVTNSVTVSGGGMTPSTATDPTTIVPLNASNDEAVSATTISTLPVSLAENTANAGVNAADPQQSCGAVNGHTVWFKYIPSFTGYLVVDTAGSNFDTVLSAYAGGVTAAAQFACNDDFNNTLQSRLSIPVTAGQIYYFEVASYSDNPGGLLNLHAARMPVLVVSKTHTGNFQQGQTGAAYTITVANQAGSPTTSGAVTVTDTVSFGLTLVSLNGAGWACGGNTCLRSDPLDGGASYPPITALVNVAIGTSSSQSNSVAVSGGGSPSATVTDPTTVVQPLLGIVLSHSGNFKADQLGATYTIVISNQAGAAPTNGSVSVTDSVPSGLTLVSMAGAGWTCSANACSRSDSLAGGSSYPPITVTVNVSANANSTYNSASVSGGGSSSAYTSDNTTITAASLSVSVSHVGSFSQGQTGAIYTIIVSNPPGVPATSGTVTVTESLPVGFTLVSMAGSGWTCVGNTCLRADTLVGGASYPSITVTVNVGNAGSAYNYVYVSGGGSSYGPSAYDYTNVTGPAVTGYRFVPITPCRILDTRGVAGTFGGPAIPGGATRSLPVQQSACNIPNNAQAYSLNMTVVPSGPLAYLTVWPNGQAQPNASTLNSYDGRIVANAAIVVAGAGGAVNLFASDTTQAIVDINGYFVPASVSGSLSFYVSTPCRVVDTRNPNGPLGGPFLAGGSVRSFVIPAGTGNIPGGAQAYSVNVTVVPRGPLGYLTAWPAGQPQPGVSTLNSLDGSVVANAAIVPAGTGGAISLFATDNTDVIVDINGYFAGPGSSGALSLYTATPCRAVDTRNGTGVFGGPILNAGAVRSFPLSSPSCTLPVVPVAYSLNVTAIPSGALAYLTAWPFGQAHPYVSTLNSPLGRVVANAAIVPAGTSRTISLFASDATHVILDINAYFGQ